jgi:hypothetical protein
MRRITAYAVFVALMFVGAPVSSGYVRFSCGGKGISSLLAATNGRGETLLVWQDGRQSGAGFCESTVADAAAGSVGAGFASLGTISVPGKLSYATGVSLDGAGDGWVIGLHEVYVDEQKYGPNFQPSGVWAAFRPAGAGFRSPIELPIGGGQAAEAWVASNRAGRTLLAWSTNLGTYLAFATDTGAISKPTFVGGGFQIAGLGVDESGRALVVGYYGSRRFEVVRIAVVTASASGSFSRPRVLVNQPRNVSKGLVGRFERPGVTVGPRGNAVITWESSWASTHTENELPDGPNFLIYRRADGHFDRPVHLSSNFLDGPDAAAFDRAGQAVLVSANLDHGLKEVAVSTSSRVGRQRRLWGWVDEMHVAVNELGQTAIAWVDGRRIDVIVGDASGFEEKPQLITTPYEVSISGVTVTMGPQGIATVFWVEEPQKGETTLWARAVTPGAQPVQIASSEVSTS